MLLTRYFGHADFNIIDKLDDLTPKSTLSSVTKSIQPQDQSTAPVRIRSGLTLPELQCMLDENGATDLVIDLIIEEPNHSVFTECLHLAIALLEGGNPIVQVRQ